MYIDELTEKIREGDVKAKFHPHYVEMLHFGAEYSLWEMIVNTHDFEDMQKEISFENFKEVFNAVFDGLEWACFPDDEETAKALLDNWNSFDSDIKFNCYNMETNEQLRELFEKNFK